jgi:hypothetical protein
MKIKATIANNIAAIYSQEIANNVAIIPASKYG